MSANKYKVLSLSSLKWIALITMLIDHTAATMVPYYNMLQELTNIDITVVYDVMRGIGRLSFPIFCFCIVEGFVHTRNVKKYLIRLLIFALITNNRSIYKESCITEAYREPGFIGQMKR